MVTDPDSRGIVPGPATARSAPWTGHSAMGDQPVALVVARLVGLALVLWGISSEVRPGASGAHLATWVLAAALVPAWLAWTTSRSGGRTQLVVFAWLGLAGGALAGLAPFGLVFVGTAGLGAATVFELPVALALAALGPAAMAITMAADGKPSTVVLGGLAASLAGIVVGVGRRQSSQRAEQNVLVTVARERAEVERARAEVLEERNRLARELHDVLAHTLGALAVQLEALDSIVVDGPGGARSLHEGIRRTRSLATDGLAEARRAVQALRDDAVPLEEQLARLCQLRGAVLRVDGEARHRPSPEVALAVYRAAQEALTNAAKHAPLAATEVHLHYEQDTLTLAVENGSSDEPAGDLASSGAGYGLDGIRERARLLGGEVSAGPSGEGWLVRAKLPL